MSAIPERAPEQATTRTSARTPARRSRLAALVATGATLTLGLGALPALAAVPAHPSSGPTAPLARATAGAWTPPAADETFHRLATYPVFENRPAGEDAAAETVAEISAVSEDGRTVVHTDALARRIGFLDITDPGATKGLGTLSLAELGSEHDEPTSVAIVGGYVLVVVDTSVSFTEPSGRLDVVDLATRERVRSLDLGGQPDSIAVTPDGTHAVVAIENQRDEEATPEGGDEGDLPQLPGGFLQVLDLPGDDPAAWSTRAVSFLDEAGAPLPVVEAAGLDTPQDPEPEYVAVNPAGTKVAVTLQENNGVAVVDIATGEVETVFSAGAVGVSGIDVKKDGVIDQTGSIPTTAREPDAIGWLDDAHVATANEGDWKGGSRGWSVFDAASGEVVWDAGAEVERLAVRVGLHTEDRAAKKGVEPEGLTVATLGGTRYAFVGSERSNFVAVYDVSDATAPSFVQVLATTNGPEGLLVVPERDLLVVSSEEDDAGAGVRSAVTVFGRGAQWADGAGSPQFPSVVSADATESTQAGAPIGWGALGALTADPADPQRLWTATDAAYSTTQLLSLDVSGYGAGAPAVIDRTVTLTRDGAPVGLDVEGVAARADGGFWLGVEGAKGAENAIVRVDAAGAVVESVALPEAVAAGLGKQGIEGVAVAPASTADGAAGGSAGEQVWVALQRGLTTDDGGTAGTARLGRYDVATGTWDWFAYPLEQTTTDGDWMGLSEVTVVDHDTLAVIERDKLNGPAAAVKRVYAVDVPDVAVGAASTTPVAVTKTLAHDVLPDLRATNGWTQEKLEGLTVAGDGTVWAITDNDGLADATGETVLLSLGAATDVFDGHLDGENPGGPGEPGETPGAGEQPPSTPLHTVGADDLTDANHGGVTLSPARVRAGEQVTATAEGFAPGEWVSATLFSTPAGLGMFRADASGTLTATVTIPADVAVGEHRFAIVGQVDGRVLWTELDVLAADGTPSGSDGEEPGRPDGLATTGAHVGALVGLAIVLVAGGVTIVVARRRMRGLPG
ncbi:esterase-like activity of phytase family protein [Cellulosimicrobium protaetiae]|uniref:Esterase-like activity of phytase family protein n=1 Tax=Cellulosimicrobium protaetiae TaxID=2587808 RepID=A0A6M5UB56_9MICO|nr:esterase-like activity of phytase family protein [Cellulosimicrobium protaetiae]QJW35344.1 esterase-like activity of phytase family protein [Cellulosimicrobium protaetiae]